MKKALLSTVFLSLAACGGGSGGTTTTTSAGTTTTTSGTGTGTTTTTTSSTGHSTTTASSTSSGTGTATATTTTGTGTGSSATAGSATTSTGGTQTVPTACTATVTTLLVDNDDSDNNNQIYSDAGSDFTPTASDLTFAAVLQDAGITYALYQVPGGSVANAPDAHPSANDLADCKTIIWYTGDVAGSQTDVSTTLSGGQDSALNNWLNQGGKTLVFFSPNLVYNLEGNNSDNEWTGLESPIDPMFNQIGAAACDTDSSEDDILSSGTDISWTMSGLGMGDAGWNIVPGGEGEPAWGVGVGGQLNYPNFDTLGLIVPDAGIDTLATVMASEPTGTALTAAIATGNKHAGTAATSTVVYVGFPVEDYVSQPFQENTPYDFFAGVNKYVTGH